MRILGKFVLFKEYGHTEKATINTHQFNRQAYEKREGIVGEIS